jgi:DNA-binding transcriptional ArsR family regulator
MRAAARAVVSPLLAACAHPVRGQILARVSERPASPSEMSTDFNVSIGVVSYHAKRLEALGLISVVARQRAPGSRGPQQTYYGATALHMRDDEWMTVPAPVRLALTGAALRELARRLSPRSPDSPRAPRPRDPWAPPSPPGAPEP